ncbi:phthiocerol/phthiodiolone dimycocerosyl transferase family protein [Nocardia altamirensis]|uniref:phthiocerol/phthiodiolone dimycocerosyl transferase family protein n=1 Tax=Nocardia altamirensis TaxID=472158 RepID=UPI000AB6B0EB|nr:hypothetical protein [Nocardia altamirensis]
MSGLSSSSVLIRPLDPSEAMFVPTGLYVGYTTRVRGELDPRALAEAFDLIRQQYPVLRSQVVPADGQPVFAATDLPPVISWRDQESDESLPDLAGRVAAIQVVRVDARTALVTLLTHHSAADGHHSLQLLADLWESYTAVVEGKSVRPQRHDYPQSVEQLLDERGITLDDAPAASVAPTLPTTAGSTPQSPSATASPDHMARVRLTAEQTRALVAIGHQAKTTINGLMSAAIMQATADSAGIGLEEVLYVYPVDLRRRLTPAVQYTAGTNVLGTAMFVADSDTPTDTVALARAITDRLAGDLASGEVHRSVLRLPHENFDPAILESPSSVVATNWGIIPPMPTPDTLTIDDFSPSVHQTSQLPGPLGNSASPPMGGIITTFQGQLTLDVTMAAGDPENLVDRVGAILAEILPAA